jgi:hypothetical protein
MNLSTGFPDTPEWRGSRDRRWIEAQVGTGSINTGENVIQVHLTDEGRKTSEPQGGKMITSVEVIQYGEADRYVKSMYRVADVRFNGDLDFVGAFPTFDDHKRMSLRPVSCVIPQDVGNADAIQTNENCLMRRVQHKSESTALEICGELTC